MGFRPLQRQRRAEGPASEFASTVDAHTLGIDSPAPAPANPTLPGASELDLCLDLPAAQGNTPTAGEGGEGREGRGGEGHSTPAAELPVELKPTLSHIGRYALKGPLGQGGLGQVHEAWDPLLSRPVAIKTLQFKLDMPSRVSLDGLILNEARAVAGLSHPHIVTVHDAGLSAHGVYIAMERLHGRDLRQALAGGWRPTSMQAALLVRRVADALAYAHARGVVHCDIKPANIFLSRRGKPKVLDFGIARVAHGSALPELDGLVMGTPNYLAPEQLQAGVVDARTDIHALGVVFYELLAARRAFVGDSLEQISAAVLGMPPPPAHELRASVPPELSRIAARAMAHDPDARHSSAAEMAAELRVWIEQQQPERPAAEPAETAGATASAPAPGSAASHHRRLPAWGLATAAALLVLGAAFALMAGSGDAPGTGTADGPAATAPAPARPVVEDATASAAPALSADATAQATKVSGTEPTGRADAAPADGSGAASPPTRTPPAGGTTRTAATRTRPGTATTAPAQATAPAAAAAVVTGEVRLAISPWGEVEVNGASAGITPPLARLSLPEGTHTITVRNGDFPAHTSTVQVSAEQPAVLRHRFGD